jgi:outer membrane lipoprotein carrier protein
MKQFAIFLIASLSSIAMAGGMNDLESFVRNVKSGRADFTQVVTAPAREGQAPRSKTSSGTFEFSRPGRFKFSYKKPFEQLITADGQTVWLYDVDLNQVTARKQSQALGATPAALIASSMDIKALQSDFHLADAPDQEGMQWVLATPKAKDSSLQSVRVGFRQNQLEKLEIVDTFGQKSVLTFTGFQSNAAINPELFQFKPPSGADIVRQ